MLESLKLVPESYRSSRDWQVIFKLLDYIICDQKYDIDHFIDIINPNKCPDGLLPLLASIVGYDYDYNEPYSSNRLIIKYFSELLTNRGSETGLKLAAALSISSAGGDRNVESLSMFRIVYDRAENKVKIYLTYPAYLKKLRDLVEVVRPAGVPVIVIPAVQTNFNEQIIVDEKITHFHDNAPSDTDKSQRGEVSDKHKVGFGEVIKDFKKED